MFINPWLVNEHRYQAADWRVAVNQSTTPPWTSIVVADCSKKYHPVQTLNNTKTTRHVMTAPPGGLV